MNTILSALKVHVWVDHLPHLLAPNQEAEGGYEVYEVYEGCRSVEGHEVV